MDEIKVIVEANRMDSGVAFFVTLECGEKKNKPYFCRSYTNDPPDHLIGFLVGIRDCAKIAGLKVSVDGLRIIEWE